MQVYRTDTAAQKAAVEIEPGALPEPDAAKFLRIGARTLFDLRRANQGPKYVKIGRSIRYPVHLLREWLDDQAKGGAS